MSIDLRCDVKLHIECVYIRYPSMMTSKGTCPVSIAQSYYIAYIKVACYTK